MDKAKIPPRDEWSKLSVEQLYQVKSDMLDAYYNMKDCNASFANQYMRYIKEIEARISLNQNAS